MHQDSLNSDDGLSGPPQNSNRGDGQSDPDKFTIDSRKDMIVLGLSGLLLILANALMFIF